MLRSWIIIHRTTGLLLTQRQSWSTPSNGIFHTLLLFGPSRTTGAGIPCQVTLPGAEGAGLVPSVQSHNLHWLHIPVGLGWKICFNQPTNIIKWNQSFLTIITSRHLKEVEGTKECLGNHVWCEFALSIAFWGRIRLAPLLMWSWLCQTSCIVCLREEEIRESCLLLIADSDFSLFRAWALALCYFWQNNIFPSAFFEENSTFTRSKQYLDII